MCCNGRCIYEYIYDDGYMHACFDRFHSPMHHVALTGKRGHQAYLAGTTRLHALSAVPGPEPGHDSWHGTAQLASSCQRQLALMVVQGCHAMVHCF